MQKSKFKSKKRTNLSAILLGICFTLVLHLVLALPGAAITNAMKNPTNAIGIVGIVTHLISGIITGLAVCKYKPDGAIFSCFVCSILFLILTLFVGIISGNGEIPIKSVINSIIYVTECTLVAVVFKWMKSKKR